MSHPVARHRRPTPASRERPHWLPYVSRVITPPAGATVGAPADIYRLCPDMMDLQQEQLRVVLLDAGNRLLGLHLVYQGTIDGVAVRLADLFREAIRVGATAIALVHNHPTGRADNPSASDLLLTAEAVRAGILLGIAVLDHVIVGREEPGYRSIMGMALAGTDPVAVEPGPLPGQALDHP